MKTGSKKTLVALTIATFWGGFGIGWFSGGLSAPSNQLPSEPMLPGETQPVPRPMAVGLAEEQVPERAREPEPPEATSTMERFLEQAAAEGMVVVPERALRKIRPVSRGRLSDEMAEMLALTEEEVSRVNRIFEEAEKKLNESELARAEIVTATDNEVVFQIPRDVEGGRRIEEEFRQELINALGGVDGELFLAVHDYSFATDTYFQEFGRVDRTVTFGMRPHAEGGVWLRFWNETPWAQKRGSHDGMEGMATWPGFEMRFPSPFPSGESVRRSKYLIPALPEPMRSHFEELERAAEQYRAEQEN